VPPSSVRTMSPSRKKAGLRPKYLPRPPQTPAMIRGDSVRSRRLTWGVCAIVCVHVYEAACRRLRWLSGNTLVRPSTLLSTSHGREADRRERRARFDYDLLERVEAGIVLTGTEVKSLRDGRTTMAQAFADIRDGEAWLNGLEISIYDQGGTGKPRAGPPAQAASAPAGDRLAVRQGP